MFVARKCHSYTDCFGNYAARSDVLLVGINGVLVGDDVADVDDRSDSV